VWNREDKIRTPRENRCENGEYYSPIAAESVLRNRPSCAKQKWYVNPLRRGWLQGQAQHCEPSETISARFSLPSRFWQSVRSWTWLGSDSSLRHRRPDGWIGHAVATGFHVPRNPTQEARIGIDLYS
jgi:hypothetical protein